MVSFTTPKVLHVTWKTREIPPQYAEYYKKWLRMTPDWTHKIYSDEDLRDVVSKVVPEYLADYDGFSANIERVDFARYAILYNSGGVYADLDTYPLKKLDEWLEKGKIVLGREPLEHARQSYDREVVLCNALMISPPREQFWLDLMKYIISSYTHHSDPVYTTGPMAMTKFYEKTPSAFKDVIITEPCVFFPLTNTGYSNKKQGGFDHVSKHCNIRDAYIVHLWSNSWCPKHFWEDPRFWNPKWWLLGFLIVLIIVCLIWWLNRSH